MFSTFSHLAPQMRELQNKKRIIFCILSGPHTQNMKDIHAILLTAVFFFYQQQPQSEARLVYLQLQAFYRAYYLTLEADSRDRKVTVGQDTHFAE